jgi:hypothetical protein
VGHLRFQTSLKDFQLGMGKGVEESGHKYSSKGRGLYESVPFALVTTTWPRSKQNLKNKKLVILPKKKQQSDKNELTFYKAGVL